MNHAISRSRTNEGEDERGPMDEKDFALLMVLGESRNMTKAADKLFITQSALSKRIKNIERELGVELLLRSHQGIRFTPLGRDGAHALPGGCA